MPSGDLNGPPALPQLQHLFARYGRTDLLVLLPNYSQQASSSLFDGLLSEPILGIKEEGSGAPFNWPPNSSTSDLLASAEPFIPHSYQPSHNDSEFAHRYEYESNISQPRNLSSQSLPRPTVRTDFDPNDDRRYSDDSPTSVKNLSIKRNSALGDHPQNSNRYVSQTFKPHNFVYPSSSNTPIKGYPLYYHQTQAGVMSNQSSPKHQQHIDQTIFGQHSGPGMSGYVSNSRPSNLNMRISDNDIPGISLRQMSNSSVYDSLHTPSLPHAIVDHQYGGQYPSGNYMEPITNSSYNRSSDSTHSEVILDEIYGSDVPDSSSFRLE